MSTSHQIDTQLFGIIHDAVRRDFGRSFDALATHTPLFAEQRAAVADQLSWTLYFLERVRVSEEVDLWPLACRRDPSAAPLLHHLAAGHARVHHAASAVEHAAHVYRNSDDTSVRDDLRGALERLCTILLPQLDREETEVAPIVAANIADTEWTTWLHGLFRTETAGEFARERQWLIDALEPVRRTYATRTFPTHRYICRPPFALPYSQLARHLRRNRTAPSKPWQCSRIRIALHQLENRTYPAVGRSQRGGVDGGPCGRVTRDRRSVAESAKNPRSLTTNIEPSGRIPPGKVHTMRSWPMSGHWSGGTRNYA